MEKKNVTRVAFIAAAMTLITLGFILLYASSSPGHPERQPSSAVMPPTATKAEPAPRGSSRDFGERTALDPQDRTDPRSLTLTLSATVEPAESVEVVSDVAGHLARLAVDIGSRVRRGDVLAEIDSPGPGLEHAKARALLQQARARINTTKAGVKVADSVVKTARAEWESSQAAMRQTEATASFRKRQYERIAELVKKGTLQNRIGEEEQARIRGDEASESAARARVFIMRASLASAEARLEVALVEVAEMEQGLHLVDVEIERARVNVESCRVRSPIDGVVTRRHHHVGEFVRPAAAGGPDAIFTVVQTQRVRVVAHVPDRDAPLVDVGDKATFRPESSNGLEHQGTVSRTAVVEGPSTRAMRIEVDLENGEGRLRPGQRGTIRVELSLASP